MRYATQIEVKILQPSPISIDGELVWLQPGHQKILPAGIANLLVAHDMAQIDYKSPIACFDCGYGPCDMNCSKGFPVPKRITILPAPDGQMATTGKFPPSR